MTRRSAIPAILVALAASLAVPVAASAEYLVPEGNSAVNQYTEGVPSAGGEKGTRNGEFSEPVKPGQAIGAENAKKLSEQGPEGQAVAEVAAETAPEAPVTENPEANRPAGHGKQGDRSPVHKGGKGKKHHGKKGTSNQESREASAGAAPAGGNGFDGSSGVGATLAAATGTEEGQLSLLLPLIIIAAVAGGATYAVRQRKQSAPQ